MSFWSVFTERIDSTIRAYTHGGGWKAISETDNDMELDGGEVVNIRRTGLGSRPGENSHHRLSSLPNLISRKNAILLTTFLIFGVAVLSFTTSRQKHLHDENPFTWPSSSAWPVLGDTISDSALYFPAQGNEYLPNVASYNLPPIRRPRTPLLIPFTRNNEMMKQTVLGYIAGGWPREDIVILDNSGTLDANSRKQLSGSNPFFLDYEMFRYRYGVSILQTPVLLNFAQLQNYMLQMALTRSWPYFFWSHMDVGILGYEEQTPYKSFYMRVLDTLTDAMATDSNWAVKWFEFDYLSLVNVEAWKKIGLWDVFIPYYATDCDAYGRLRMLGFTTDEVRAGHIWDVADYVKDPETKFFPSPAFANGAGSENSTSALNSTRFQQLKEELRLLEKSKHSNSKGRNTWQNMQKGGKGEAWTYDPAGFQSAWWQTAKCGRDIFHSKWGTTECDLVSREKSLGNMWQGVKETTGKRDITENKTRAVNMEASFAGYQRLN